MKRSTEDFEWGDALPTLAGEHVSLRPLVDDDVAGLFAIFSDAEVMRYWGWPRFEKVEQAFALLHEIDEHFRNRRLFQWGISDSSRGSIVGTCTLFHLNPMHRRAEVGFALARRSWGKGLATEALGVLIAFAFDALDLLRLEADADPRNARSLRLLERHGFKREGYLRQRYRVGGEVQDSVFLGLLEAEWRMPRECVIIPA